jgi:hypothetical protein
MKTHGLTIKIKAKMPKNVRNCESWASFAGRCCVTVPFFAWRESFSRSEVVSAHTSTTGGHQPE